MTCVTETIEAGLGDGFGHEDARHDRHPRRRWSTRQLG
jgi:hypothetical protein